MTGQKAFLFSFCSARPSARKLCLSSFPLLHPSAGFVTLYLLAHESEACTPSSFAAPASRWPSFWPFVPARVGLVDDKRDKQMSWGFTGARGRRNAGGGSLQRQDPASKAVDGKTRDIKGSKKGSFDNIVHGKGPTTSDVKSFGVWA